MISRIITRMIPIVPRRIIERVARRYIAGETAQDAVQAALRLKDKGYNVRIYIPFGKKWYEYSIRRLRENPGITGAVLKGLFSRDYERLA